MDAATAKHGEQASLIAVSTGNSPMNVGNNGYGTSSSSSMMVSPTNNASNNRGNSFNVFKNITVVTDKSGIVVGFTTLDGENIGYDAFSFFSMMDSPANYM